MVAVVVVVMLPADYFIDAKTPPAIKLNIPAPLAMGVLITVNLMGYCCLLLGVILLFLPGQGLLMIFVGLTLISFPGKYQLQRRLILNPGVFLVVNRLRKWRGREPLELSE